MDQHTYIRFFQIFSQFKPICNVKNAAAPMWYDAEHTLLYICKDDILMQKVKTKYQISTWLYV